MEEKLFDEHACLHTIGCLILDPTLVDDINKPLDRTDFRVERFYEIVFVSIYNLVMQGVEVIDEFAIDSYLSHYKEQYKIFEDNDGINYIARAREMATLDNYDWYYHRLRKFSLLRYYQNNHLDTRFIYDPDAEDVNGQEQKKFDDYTEQQIVEEVESLLAITPKMTYCSNILSQNVQAGDGLIELVDSLMDTPDYGYPFTSLAFNTICRGARKGRLYLRSASTSTGKSRNFLMDAANFAIPYVYDSKEKRWKHTGHSVPTLYIGVEGSIAEFQTILLAAVSGVNEEHIVTGEYKKGELERVRKASEYIKESPLYLTYCDDYSINDIENIIKRFIYSHQVEIVIFDYLQSSLRLFEEVTKKSGGGLKEYQLLLIFATRMKALAERLDICLISGTQLNGEADDAKYKTAHVLQGSKAIAQKVDIGSILSVPNNAEKKKIDAIRKHKIGCPEINMLNWCYKVRAGRLTHVIICSHMDLGTMRIEDCFCTDFDFNLLDIDYTNVEVVEETINEHSKPIRKEDLEEPEMIEEKQKRKIIYDENGKLVI